KATYQKWIPILEALEAGAWLFWVVEKKIIVAEIPKTATMDQQRRLHGETGPAFAWLDDVRDYYWHGVNVPAHVIEHPEKITVAEIEAQTNAEVRRVMTERYGLGR